MIRASLAAFINASELGTILGVKAYVMTPDLVLSETQLPRALVSYLHEGPQDLWVVGDAQRKENPELSVMFCLRSPQEVRDVRARFKRLIESATATDSDSVTRPGINFMAVADLLDDSGDHLTYISNQPNWFASPAPIVYKEAAGVPVVVASGYTVDSTHGKVTFGSSQGVGAKIRSTYKVGLIDFDVSGVAEPQEADAANNPSKYNVVFDLVTHFYVKTNANKYL